MDRPFGSMISCDCVPPKPQTVFPPAAMLRPGAAPPPAAPICPASPLTPPPGFFFGGGGGAAAAAGAAAAGASVPDCARQALGPVLPGPPIIIVSTALMPRPRPTPLDTGRASLMACR